MKKISSAILAAVALAAFGFVSCDHDYSNSDILAGTPSTVKQAEIDAANKGGSDEDANKGGSDEEEPEANITVDAAWDFKSGANASQNATILAYGATATKPTSEITIDADSGSGATLVLLVQTGCSVKYNTGLQWGSGSKETEVIKITADDACTLTVKGNGASGESSFTAAKPNSFSVNGTSVYTRTEASDTAEQEWTVSLNKGDNTIAVSGMKFISFSVAK